MSRDARFGALLDFWFGDDPDDARVAQQNGALWFAHRPRHDREIAARFGGLLDDAERGALDSWRGHSHAHLALIVVLDQFSRVIGRGTARAFQNDARALGLSRELFDTAAERELRPIARAFLHLPLEHAEIWTLQEESVARSEALAEEVPAPWRDSFERFAHYARRHAEIIRRFGRFPHRNEILKRVSTTEELAFLRDPSVSF